MGMIGNSLAQGLISGANIQDGTVDTPDIKDAAVTAAKVNPAGTFNFNNINFATAGGRITGDFSNATLGRNFDRCHPRTTSDNRIPDTTHHSAGDSINGIPR